jgi:DNA replication protein DnaC
MMPPVTCPICQDAHWILLETASGKTLTRCPCQSEPDAQRRRERLRATSGLAAFSQQTFATFDAQREPRAAASARAYADQPAGFLLLHGGYGTGKTHLAMAIGNACLERGIAGYVYTAPDLLDTLQTSQFASPQTFEQLMQTVCRARLLIVDDLGAERPTETRDMRMFQIIGERYQRRLPTVITSNFAPTSERFEPRLRSRLGDEAVVQAVFCGGTDYRAVPLDDRRAA